MRIDELKQLLSAIDRNINSFWNRTLEIHSKLKKVMYANGFPEFSEEDISKLLAEDQAEDVQALAKKLHNSSEVIGKNKEYQALEQKRRAYYNSLSSIILLKGFLIHISMIDEEGKAQKRAYTRYDPKDVPEKAFDNAPKYTELYQASKLSELEYTFISNICEKTIKEEAIQYYKPALVNGMADFIRTFLPDAMPNREIEDQGNIKLMAIPSGPGINNFMQVLSNPNPEKLKKYNKKSKTTITTRNGDYGKAGTIHQYEFETDNSKTTIQWINMVANSNKGVRKMFIYSLREVMKQAYHQDSKGKGQVDQKEISFPLSNLVEEGMYGSLRAARRGFEAALDVLLNFRFKTVIKNRYNNSKNNEDYATMIFFRGHSIVNNQCYIYLEPDANWDALLRFYTYFPNFIFNLNNNAFMLLYNICFLARQNCESIKGNGCFRIKMSTVQSKLGLPDIQDSKNPTTQIIEPIENAISEIEEYQAKINTETDYIKITPILHDKYSYRSYLENGYLEIEIAGKYAEKFAEIAANKDKAIANKVRIQEKAQCNALKEIYKDKLKKEEQEAQEQEPQGPDVQEQTTQEQVAQEQPNQ